MGKFKKNSVAEQVMNKFYQTLKGYCEQRDLSYSSMARGFYSLRAKKILKDDGIDLVLAGIEKVEDKNAAD